jgi:WD40 repeat protein/tetratricopeptide (TPR) repeat protein
MIHIVQRLLQTIQNAWKLDDNLSVDPNTYIATLDQYISRTTGMIVLIIDGAEELQPPFDWDWLPQANGRFKCIVGALDGASALAEMVGLRRLTLDMRGMVPEIASALIAATAKEIGKSIDEEQSRRLIARSGTQPVEYLVVALEELRVFATFDSVLERIEKLPDSVVELYDELIDGLEQLDRGLVENLLPLLVASPVGLSESELSELCCVAVAKPSRVADIQELLSRLRSHIIRSGPLIQIASDRFKEAIQRRFVAADGTSRAIERRLLLFGLIRIPSDRLPDRAEDRRWVRLIPSHAIRAGEYHRIFDLFADVRWLRTYLYAFGLEVLLRDFEKFAALAKPFLKPTDFGVLRLVGDALRMSASGLLLDPRSLPQQLAGRLAAPVRQSLFANGFAEFEGLVPRGQILSPGGPDIVAALPTGEREVMDVQVDCHGRFVAAGSDQGDVLIWDSQSGLSPARLVGHQGGFMTERNDVAAIELSPSGDFVVSGGHDGAVRVWDTRRRMPMAVFGHRLPVYVLQRGRRPETFISAGADGFVLEWDVERLRQVSILANHGSPVLALAWAADQKKMVTGGADKIILVWDMTTSPSRIMHVLKGHCDVIYGLAIVGDVLHSCALDGQIRQWNLSSGAQIRTKVCSKVGITSIAPTPDGERVCFGDCDGFVGILEWRTGGIVTTWAETPGEERRDRPYTRRDAIRGKYPGRFGMSEDGWREMRIRCVVIHPSGEWFITVVNRGDILSWDFRASRTAHLELHADMRIFGAAFSADGRYCAATGDDAVTVYDIAEKSRKSDYTGTRAYAVLFVRDTVVTASDDGYLLRYSQDLSDFERMGGHPAEISALSVSPCETRLASVDQEGELRVWDLVHGGESEQFCDLCFDNPIAFNQLTRQVAGQTFAGETFVINLDTLKRQPLSPSLEGRPAFRAAADYRWPSLDAACEHDESIVATTPNVPAHPFRVVRHGCSIWLERKIALTESVPRGVQEEGRGSAVSKVRFSASGEFAVALQFDGSYRVWPTTSPMISDPPRVVASGGIKSIEVLDDTRAIVLDDQGALSIIRTLDGAILETLGVKAVPIADFRVNEKKSIILTIDREGIARILRRDNSPLTFPTATRKAFLSHQGRYVVAQVDDHACVFNRDGVELSRSEHYYELSTCASHPDDLFLVVGFLTALDRTDYRLAAWNPGDVGFGEFGGGSAHIRCKLMCWCGRGDHFAVAWYDHSIELWDARKREVVKEWRFFDDWICFLEADRKGTVLVAASSRRLVVIALPEGELLATFVPDAMIWSCALSPDGRVLVVVDGTGVIIFDLVRSQTRLVPNVPDPLNDFVEKMSAAEDADDLRKLATRAVRLFPDRKPLIWEIWAKTLLDLGVPSEAEAMIARYLKKHEGTVELYRLRAMACISIAKQGFQSAPNTRYHAMKDVEKASRWWEDSQWFKALVNLEKAIACDPSNADARFTLGLVHSRMNCPAAAMIDFEVAVKLGNNTAPSALKVLLNESPELAILPREKLAQEDWWLKLRLTAEEEAEIRRLGGQFDRDVKRFYVPCGMEIGFFRRWLPDGMPLHVPFEEKDQAYRLGALWDNALKTWYVSHRHKNTDVFLKWRRLPSFGPET